MKGSETVMLESALRQFLGFDPSSEPNHACSCRLMSQVSTSCWSSIQVSNLFSYGVLVGEPVVHYQRPELVSVGLQYRDDWRGHSWVRGVFPVV